MEDLKDNIELLVIIMHYTTSLVIWVYMYSVGCVRGVEEERETHLVGVQPSRFSQVGRRKILDVPNSFKHS